MAEKLRQFWKQYWKFSGLRASVTGFPESHSDRWPGGASQTEVAFALPLSLHSPAVSFLAWSHALPTSSGAKG